MTDVQTVVAAIAGAAGTIAGAIRWSARRRAKASEILGSQIESLSRQIRQGDELTRKEIALGVARLETAVSEIQANASRLERATEILERDARLDESQRAKIARIRAKIARGIASHAQAGSSGEDDG